MPFTGGWKNAAAQPIQAAQHQADASHTVNRAAQPTSQFVYSAPPGVDLGSEQLPGMDVYDSTDLPNEPYDQAPEDHDEGGGRIALPNVVEQQSTAYAISAKETGGVRRALYAVPAPQFYNERYEGARFESNAHQDPGPVAIQRGLNSLPENQPAEGYRKGYVMWNWTDRKFFVGQRVHDHRVAPSVNTATPPYNIPPGTTPYQSPFSSLAKGLYGREWNSPMVRREAPPVDQTIMSDGYSDYVGDYDPTTGTVV